MKKMIVVLLFLLLASCAGKQQVDPNYQAMLESGEKQVELYANIDRAILRLEVGDTPLTLPPGARLVVNSQVPDLPLPVQFRDYALEARYQFWGNVVAAVAQPGLTGLFGWLGQKENRKLFDGVFSSRGGIDFNSEGDLYFSGGIGDAGQRGYSTPAPVVVPPVIVPPVLPAAGGTTP